MIIFGVGGGSGSGKTYLCSNVQNRFPEKTLIFSLDRYYKPFKDKDPEERKKINFDDPSTLDWDLIKKHIRDLRKNQSINMPKYSFEENTRIGYEIEDPREIILIEGIHAFHDRQLNELMDYKIFIDPDPEIRAVRRMKRDILERDRDPEFAAKQFLEKTHPSHHKHVEPTKSSADVVMDSRDFDNFIGKVEEKVKNGESKLESQIKNFVEKVA